jgi:hypothetical protein
MFRYCLLFFTLIPDCGNAQTLEILEGTIYSGKDSTVVVGASIYFDGTNLGVSSNIDGKFSIKKGEGIAAPLVISSLGFQTIALHEFKAYINKSLKIYLAESTESLEAVFLETDPWSRKKKLAIFKRKFLGNTKETLQCKIINEDDIQLVYVPSKDILLAYAQVPLKITNRFLGYEVNYNLQNFKINFSTGESGFRLTRLVYYEGYSYFKELRKKPSKKIMSNREETYMGSSLHFMRSLADKKLSENGFRIFFDKFEVPPYQYFNIKPTGQATQIEVLRDELSILFNDLDQSLLATKGNFIIDQWGNHYPPANVIFGGEMSHSRISRTLPLNFMPEK